MIRFAEKLGASQFLARLMAPSVDAALPQLTEHDTSPNVPKDDPNPLADEQGVIQVPRHYELSPEQIDHVLRRIHYDKKHKDLAEEIKNMTMLQQHARPFTVG